MAEHETLPEAEELRLGRERREGQATMECVCGMFIRAQEACDKYASTEREFIYLTPAHFLRTFKYHSYLLGQKRVTIKKDQDKYFKGLEKLKKGSEEEEKRNLLVKL